MHLSKHQWWPFIRYPKSSLVFSLVACLPIWSETARYRAVDEPGSFLDGDRHSAALLKEVKRLVGIETILIIDLTCDEVFSNDCLHTLEALGDTFERRSEVRYVKSLSHSVMPVRVGLAFEFRPLIPAGILSDRRLLEIRKLSLNHPFVRNILVSADAEHALITVDLDQEFVDKWTDEQYLAFVDETLEPFRSRGHTLHTLAMPLVSAEVRESLKRDFLLFGLAVFVVTASAFGIAFRSGRTVVFVLLSALLLTSLSPAFVQLSARSLSGYGFILLPLLASIQLALLAHVCSAFLVAYNSGRDRTESVLVMISEIFRSCSVATLTTSAGLAALMATPIASVRAFGMIGSIGVIVLFGLTFGPGIALLQLCFPERREKPEINLASTADSAWNRFSNFVSRFRLRVIAAALAVFAIGLPGIFLIHTDFRVGQLFDESSDTGRALEIIDRNYGGYQFIHLEVDSGVDNGATALPFLVQLEKLESFVRSQPAVSAAYSYSRLFAVMNQIWQGGATDALHITDSVMLQSMFALALKAENYPLLDILADPSKRVANLYVRVPDSSRNDFLNILNETIAFAKNELPPHIRVSARDGIHTLLESDMQVIESQRYGLLAALAAVGILLSITWRSVVLALFGAIVAAIPLLAAFGLTGYLGISVNSLTAMVAAIVLGIAVDDAVHFITYWLQHVGDGERAQDGLATTFRVKGRPILLSTVIMVVVFLLFTVSAFPPVRTFGLLAGFGLGATGVTMLLVLPAMLVATSLFSRKRSRP